MLKMKVTFLIFLISVTCVYGASSPNLSNRGLDYMNKTLYEEAMQSKCVSNGQSNDHFKRAYNAASDCISSKFLIDSEPPHPTEKHEEFCKFLKEQQFSECIKIFTTDLLPCLDETETYLQDFVLNAISSGYNKICGPTGLSTLKYLVEKFKRTEECIAYSVVFYMGSGICLSDLIFFQNLDKGIMNLNKENVCFDLDSLRNCSARITERVCNRRNGNEDFTRFNNLVFSPFLEQCKDFNEINSVESD